MAKKISKGSLINLHGSNEALRLTADAEIEEISDQSFVGLLLNNKETNWGLNQGNFEGNYSVGTGVKMLNECQNCGKEIPAEAITQRMCETCIQASTLERETGPRLREQESKAVAAAAAEKKAQEDKAIADREAKAKADKAATDKAEADKKAADKAEADRKAAAAKAPANANKAAADKAAADKATADRAAASKSAAGHHPAGRK